MLKEAFWAALEFETAFSSHCLLEHTNENARGLRQSIVAYDGYDLLN
jgi:hypothetical protein